MLLIVVLGNGSAATVLLGKVGGLGGEELSSEILGCVVFVVRVPALAGLAVLELGVGWQEALVVGRSSQGFFASRLVKGIKVSQAGRTLGWWGSTYRIKGRPMCCGHCECGSMQRL